LNCSLTAAISCRRLALRKGAHKAAALRSGPAEERRLAQNHCPGVEAGDQQQDQHGDGHGPLLRTMSMMALNPEVVGVSYGRCSVVCLQNKKEPRYEPGDIITSFSR
jgi:hypothetical protein